MTNVRRVLVTDGEQRSALAIVRSLGSAGHSPFVCSVRGRSIAGASRFAVEEAAVPDPLTRPSDFVSAISELIARWDIEVLLPVTDASCLAVLPSRARLPDVCIPLAEAEAYCAISDKRALLERAKQLGIAIPDQRVLAAPQADFEAASAGLRFPLVIKPARSVTETADGTRFKSSVVHVASESELGAALSSLSPSAYPVLLQQRIEGPGVGVFLLCWDGHPVASFSHRRIREKPPSGGVSVYRESVRLDPQLAEQSEALLKSHGWRGVAMVEYKIEASSGTAFLMEVNGRFWGSLQLAIDAGVDFPALLMELAMDRPPPMSQPAYTVGVRSRWWWGDVDQLLLRLRRSKQQLGLGPAEPGRLRAVYDFAKIWRSGDRSEVLRLRDPRPFLRESLAWFKRQ